MPNPLTKSQIAARLADKHGLSKKTAVGVLDSLAHLAQKQARHSFTLPGIGKLVLVQRNARMGRNPATGQAINIPAKKVLKFRVAKACKEAVGASTGTVRAANTPRPSPAGGTHGSGQGQ